MKKYNLQLTDDGLWQDDRIMNMCWDLRLQQFLSQITKRDRAMHNYSRGRTEKQAPRRTQKQGIKEAFPKAVKIDWSVEGVKN